MEDPDQQIFIQLYNQLNNKIFRHLYFRVNDREKAKDLMQETFMKTWAYLQKRSDIDNLPAFLYKVATNLAIDESKKKKSISLEQIMEDGFSPSKGDEIIHLKNKLDVNDLLNIINELSTLHKEIIILRYVDELTIPEMAKILDQSENYISVNIHRALQQLRKILNKNDYV